MTKKLNKYLLIITKEFSSKVLIYTLLICLSMHLTNLKLLDIKISEMFYVLMLFLNIDKIQKLEISLLVYFSFFLCVTIIRNSYIDFSHVPKVHNILKYPYWISVSRYFEYMSCIGFLLFIRITVANFGSLLNFLRFVVYINALIVILILVLYAFSWIGIDPLNVSYHDRNFLRLRGFFIEGGPFGLFCATLFILTQFILPRERRVKLLVVFFVACLLGVSISGLIIISLFGMLKFILSIFKMKIRYIYRIVIVMAIIIMTSSVIVLLSQVYIKEIVKTTFNDQISTIKRNSFLYSSGRVPGVFIVKEMVEQNPLFGIGMGNYPLLRNLDRYRGEFIENRYIWDSHGLGGIIDVLVQFGVIGLIGFFTVLFVVSHKENRMGIIIMLFPFLLGVQLHFHYPWLLLNLKNKSIASINDAHDQ